MLPIVALAVWETALGIGYGMDQGGFQTLVVLWSFVFVTVLTAAFTTAAGGPSTQRRLVDVGWLLLVVYVLAVISTGFNFGAPNIFGPRSFGLEALLLTAVAIPYKYDVGWSSRIFPWAGTLGIGISLSRTALAGAAVLLAVRVAISRRGFNVVVFSVFAAATLALLYGIIVSNPLLYERFFVGDEGFQIGGITISTQGRNELWPDVLAGASNSPIIGHGPGSVRNYIAFVDPGESQPHNEFLRTYYEGGIVGVSLLAGGLVWILTATVRRIHSASGTAEWRVHVAGLLALLAFLAGALTDNSMVYSFVMVPLALAIGSSVGLPSSGDWLNSDPSGKSFFEPLGTSQSRTRLEAR